METWQPWYFILVTERDLLRELGSPADRPLAPVRDLDRRAFDEVVHRGGW